MGSNNIIKIKVFKNALEVEFANGKCVTFEDCWLRDHCRCSSCYRADTFQRVQHVTELPDVEINDVTHDKEEIVVTWSDNHKSTYKSDFLIQFDYESWKESRRLRPILWHGSKVSEKISRVNVAEFLNSSEGARSVFQSLLDYGVVLIEGVQPNVEATEAVCKALGGVQRTLFGDMWTFTMEADHADTAYTNLPLALHNDSTYFTEAAGLQVLHCIQHVNPQGGETILVDGFYGAKCLSEECPECFDFLTNFDVEAEYLEEGHHHTYSAPVIRVDNTTGDINQIRFNAYDRAPMAFENKENCKLYYRSLKRLAAYYEDPENQWQFKLEPGVVMAIDNFRLLHGRTGFTGQRVMCGSYVARSDWLDRARTLGLIR